MKVVSLKNKKKNAWIEVSDSWHICLEDIPNTWALGYALFRYFSSISSNPWLMNYSFMRLDCSHCNQSTSYEEAFDIKDTYSDKGQIGCPHCGTPWLTFEYENKECYPMLREY